MKQQIVSRWDSAKVLFECEVPDADSGIAMRVALEKATLSGADLSGADLRDADRFGPTRDESDALARPLPRLSPRALYWSAYRANMKLGGLPFTNANFAGFRVPVALYYTNLTFAGPVVGTVDLNATTITLETVATGAGSSALPIDTAATIRVHATYFL